MRTSSKAVVLAGMGLSLLTSPSWAGGKKQWTEVTQPMEFKQPNEFKIERAFQSPIDKKKSHFILKVQKTAKKDEGGYLFYYDSTSQGKFQGWLFMRSFTTKDPATSAEKQSFSMEFCRSSAENSTLPLGEQREIVRNVFKIIENSGQPPANSENFKNILEGGMRSLLNQMNAEIAGAEAKRFELELPDDLPTITEYRNEEDSEEYEDDSSWGGTGRRKKLPPVDYEAWGLQTPPSPKGYDSDDDHAWGGRTGKIKRKNSDDDVVGY